ncbi:MAG: LCP family protein [bacterium]
MAVFFSARSRIVRSLTKFERINMVWIGTDWVDYSRHSDTVICASYEPRTRFLDILSIPRDTLISIPGVRLKRINEIFAYYYRLSKKDYVACEKLMEAVERLLSAGKSVEIPYYVQINYDGFIKAVDLLGGVPIHISEPMDYDDYSGNLHIHFDTGTYKLDGRKALEYVRFRGRSGDRGRIFRQQLFIKTAFSRFKNPLILLQIPRMLYRVISNLQTNLSLWDLLCLGLDFRFLRKANIRLLELPGRPHRWYWIPDKERLAGVVNLMTSPYTPVDYRSLEQYKDIDNGKKIIVEVFNASSHKQLAYRVTKFLRQAGFDVVNWENYETPQQRTLVVDRTGDVRAAQTVAAQLNNAEVISRIDRSRMVDVTVILGEEYE